MFKQNRNTTILRMSVWRNMKSLLILRNLLKLRGQPYLREQIDKNNCPNMSRRVKSYTIYIIYRLKKLKTNKQLLPCLPWIIFAIWGSGDTSAKGGVWSL